MIGRLLADYSKLELGLLNCVHMGTGDFDKALKSMFRVRGEKRRIDNAGKLALSAYKDLGLGKDFQISLAAMRHALRIRNQYAHWTWWDDQSGSLAIANLEDLAKAQRANDLSELRACHVSATLLSEQLNFYAYVDGCLAWVNYEGRRRSKKLRSHRVTKPKSVSEPQLCRPYCSSASDRRNTILHHRRH